jgi:hypothetical protein
MFLARLCGSLNRRVGDIKRAACARHVIRGANQRHFLPTMQLLAEAVTFLRRPLSTEAEAGHSTTSLHQIRPSKAQRLQPV